MENETIESFLKSLGLDNLITKFKNNDIDLGLLMDLSETGLREISDEIDLSIGHRFKIASEIKRIKAGGKYTELDVFRQMLMYLFIISMKSFYKITVHILI